MHITFTFCILIHLHTNSLTARKGCRRGKKKKDKTKSSVQKYKVYFNEFSDVKTACKVCKTLKSIRFKPLMKSICLTYDSLFSQHTN